MDRDSNPGKIVLTAKRIAALSEVGRYADARVPGLNFQISRTGGRSWVLRFQLHMKERMLGLGRADLVSVDYARDRAWAAWRQILDGVDPVEAKREKATPGIRAVAPTMTFTECATTYIEAHRAGWKNPKHAMQWRATLESYAMPHIGAIDVSGIATSDIMNVLKPIWTAKPETASRVRGRIECILDWATVAEYRKGDNPARWKGHLAHLLPATGKVAKVQHHPAIPYVDLPAFMADVRSREGISARALEFTVLAACRTNEVTCARRSEIDWDAKTWIIPGERMKSGREHRVPLTDRAIIILESLPCEPGSDFLFIGVRAGKPISNAAMAELMKEIGAPSATEGRNATVHGMRSTFRDWAGETTNFPRELAEAALAHVLSDKTEAAYQRGDLLLKRRKLMEAWAAYCASPARKGEVVPLRKKA